MLLHKLVEKNFGACRASIRRLHQDTSNGSDVVILLKQPLDNVTVCGSF